MIVAEISIVLISIAGVYGIKVVAKKVGYKLSKKKLRKLLNKGFELMDHDLIKSAISSLSDFDGKYSTNKLDKYLLEVIKANPKLNEKNVLALAKEFTFDSIFDDDVKEQEREDEEEEIRHLDIIEERIEETREVLSEVEKRRKEIMLRKNLIRRRQAGKQAKRRSTGSMG